MRGRRHRRYRSARADKMMRRRRENVISFYHNKAMNRLREKISLLERIKELGG